VDSQHRGITPQHPLLRLDPQNPIPDSYLAQLAHATAAEEAPTAPSPTGSDAPLPQYDPHSTNRTEKTRSVLGFADLTDKYLDSTRGGASARPGTDRRRRATGRRGVRAGGTSPARGRVTPAAAEWEGAGGAGRAGAGAGAFGEWFGAFVFELGGSFVLGLRRRGEEWWRKRCEGGSKRNI